MGLLMLLVLIALLIAAVPAWPHSRKWGYYPTGGIGTAAMILLVLLLPGIIPGRY